MPPTQLGNANQDRSKVTAPSRSANPVMTKLSVGAGLFLPAGFTLSIIASKIEGHPRRRMVDLMTFEGWSFGAH